MNDLVIPQEKFRYVYLKGPLESPEMLDAAIEEGNCRLALQLYFYKIHRLFLKKDEVYLPGAYRHLGRFIFEEEPIIFENLKPGDIIYAQNLRNKKNEQLNRNLENYKDKDEWLFHLHSAIYIGKIKSDNQLYVWHATSIENGTALWTLDKFNHYYKPVSVKRVL